MKKLKSPLHLMQKGLKSLPRKESPRANKIPAS